MRRSTARLTDATLPAAFAAVTTIAIIAAGPDHVASDIGHRLTTGLGFSFSTALENSRCSCCSFLA